MSNLNLLIYYVVLLAVLQLIGTITSIGRRYIMTVISNRVTLDMRNDVYKNLMALSLDFYDRSMTGDIVARIFDYVRQINAFLTDGSPNFIFMRVWRATSNFMSHVTSIISSISLVKVLGRENVEIERFKRYAGEIYDANIDLAKLNIPFSEAINYIMSLSQVIVMFIGGFMVINGETTIGTITAVLSYLSRIYGSIQFLGTYFNKICE
jgi:ABC-type bacteriocin/lantibiotic exporter with double-glycine peptidase domain